MPTGPPVPMDDPSLSLAMAMVCASPTPLLLLDRLSNVIAASASFCQAFNIDPSGAVGQPVFSLGSGEWDSPQLRALMEAIASGDAAVDSYEFDLREPNREVRHLVLKVRNLTNPDTDLTRLMVAVADVTEARALAVRDRTLSDNNALLVKEARHRIANSLQIIASVMMLNARRTSSEETRGHLRDAHNRVLSVAELQQQLAVSTEGEVAIGPYLTRLCQTITASMIADPKALCIRVSAPDVDIDADISVSLGLIATELVINALKHAFPNGAGGEIQVSYERNGSAWSLSVGDNGVGMPAHRAKAKPGLGTSIVQALASQLAATVEVDRSEPGTRISIVHPATAEARAELAAV